MWEFLITLWHSPRGQFVLKNLFIYFFYLLNFTRILWFFWDLRLTLFDIPKDVVLAEILVLSNIFGFPVVNWAPKWTKTVNFGCVSFEPKFKILKDFSNTAFALLEDYLCSKCQQDLTIFGGVRAQNPQKGGHFMDAESIRKTLKMFTFTTTTAILIKLTTNIYLN